MSGDDNGGFLSRLADAVVPKPLGKKCANVFWRGLVVAWELALTSGGGLYGFRYPVYRLLLRDTIRFGRDTAPLDDAINGCVSLWRRAPDGSV